TLNGPQSRSYVPRLLFPLPRTLCADPGAALSHVPRGEGGAAAASTAAARAAGRADGRCLDARRQRGGEASDALGDLVRRDEAECEAQRVRLAAEVGAGH